MKPIKTEIAPGEGVRLDRLMNKMVHHTISSPPRYQLRVSGLPYCPIVDLANQAANEDGEWDYAGEYYTTIGTAIHSLIQAWITKISVEYEVWSNWKCTKCGKIKYDCIMPKKPHCEGAELEYVEYDFSDFPGLDSAHVDLLLKHRKTGKWTVGDFKTTGTKLFTIKFWERYYPEHKHLIQLQTYGVLFWLVLKRRISYYAVIYIGRERPFERKGKKTNYFHRTYAYKFTSRVFKETQRRLMLAIEGRQHLMSKPQKLYKLKPCTNRRSYLNYMNAGWFGKDMCPFYLNGSCFRKKTMLKRIKKWQKEILKRQ